MSWYILLTSVLILALIKGGFHLWTSADPLGFRSAYIRDDWKVVTAGLLTIGASFTAGASLFISLWGLI